MLEIKRQHLTWVEPINISPPIVATSFIRNGWSSALVQMAKMTNSIANIDGNFILFVYYLGSIYDVCFGLARSMYAIAKCFPYDSLLCSP